MSFEGCRNEARGTIDKFECSPAPPSNLQLFSAAGESAPPRRHVGKATTVRKASQKLYY